MTSRTRVRMAIAMMNAIMLSPSAAGAGVGDAVTMVAVGDLAVLVVAVIAGDTAKQCSEARGAVDVEAVRLDAAAGAHDFSLSASGCSPVAVSTDYMTLD
jgi:hypothetical protein